MFYVKRSRFVSFLAVSLFAHLTDKGLINISAADAKALFSRAVVHETTFFQVLTWSWTQRLSSGPFSSLILCCCLRWIGKRNWKSCGWKKKHPYFILKTLQCIFHIFAFVDLTPLNTHTYSDIYAKRKWHQTWYLNCKITSMLILSCWTQNLMFSYIYKINFKFNLLHELDKVTPF